MVRNLKITLAYDGSDFHGWQVQPERATIQGALATAMEHVTGTKLLPQGSGRTDAGVHALAQVASCQLNAGIPTESLQRAINHVLPSAIRVLSVEEAAPEFHARKSARAKTYRYRIYRGEVCPPFLARYVYHYPYPLDEEAMQVASPSSSANMTSRRSPPSIRSATARRMRPRTCAQFTRRNGSGTGKNLSILSEGADSFTIW